MIKAKIKKAIFIVIVSLFWLRVIVSLFWLRNFFLNNFINIFNTKPNVIWTFQATQWCINIPLVVWAVREIHRQRQHHRTSIHVHQQRRPYQVTSRILVKMKEGTMNKWYKKRPRKSSKLLFLHCYFQGNQSSNHHVSNCQSISSNNADGDDDVWRGHSIAALRRRASELNSSIPSYLHHNYEHHSSVYWK